MENKLTERDKLMDKVQNLSVDEIADMFIECYEREQALKAEHRKVLESVKNRLELYLVHDKSNIIEYAMNIITDSLGKMEG